MRYQVLTNKGINMLTNDQQPTQTNWIELAHSLRDQFAKTAHNHDENDTFVSENYDILKQHKLFSACVPLHLGGGGATYAEFSDMLRIMAQGCGSTALSLSMHSHLLAANLWKYSKNQPVEGMLKRVAAEQLVLISTGASDWLHASGAATKVDGGYKINGRKVFASGSPCGDLLVTSAVLDDNNNGKVVLHFPIPFSNPGLSVNNNWKAMGMRGTGSNEITLSDVFVPEEAVALRRPQGVWHPFFNVVTCVAMPYIVSVYLGIAEAAVELVKEKVQFRRHDTQLPYLLGETETLLTTAQLAWKEMVSLNDEYQFEPNNQTASKMFQCKTIAAKAILSCVAKCMETLGGQGFHRGSGLERLIRDAQGVQFHPIPEKRQHHFTGSVSLELEPLG